MTASAWVSGAVTRHPRGHGAFPRVLGYRARQEGVLSLKVPVAKRTGRPAAALGVTDRGRIAAGLAADLVVFDPATIADRSTYQQPHQYPAGIHCAIVNGVVGLDAEVRQDHRPGRVLRRGMMPREDTRRQQ